MTSYSAMIITTAGSVICRDEGCFELAKYLCRMDFVLADMMDLKLTRTQTLAENGAYCDFRYGRKSQ